METLEEAVEEVLRQSFVRKNQWDYGKKPKQDVLFFPRNKIRLMKVRSGNWEPRAWFIKERTTEKATKLELPTEISHEGLTSGYRSGIIKDRNERYWKLKGICLGRLVGEPKIRGLCDIGEAIEEQINSLGLTYEGMPHLEVFPGFIETHQYPLKQPTIDNFLKLYNETRGFIHTKKVREKDVRSFKTEMRKYDGFIKSLDGKTIKDHYFVSALQIRAETRLDEAMYNLTRKELKGTIKTERDNLMHSLAFRAGIAKASLNLEDFSWGKDLKNTNNHLGNFVLITTQGGMLDIGIVDISDIQRGSSFKENYHKHLQEELESLAKDFNSRTTFSTATPLRHRYFPQELKEECINAMKTGYAMMLLYTRYEHKDIRPISKPEKIFVPTNFMISIEEFKYLRDKITK
jgi:hypothetical protein